jgi:hypothetical protein
MVGSGPGGLLYPYVVRGYRKSTSPDQEELFGHRRGRLGRQVVGLPLDQRSWEPGIAAWTRSTAALSEPGLLAPPATRVGTLTCFAAPSRIAVSAMIVRSYSSHRRCRPPPAATPPAFAVANGRLDETKGT